MSCEGRFKHFCAAVGASLGAMLGDGAQALVDIQEIARSRAPEKPTPVPADADLATRMRGLSAQARETEAEAKTVALFRLMACHETPKLVKLKREDRGCFSGLRARLP